MASNIAFDGFKNRYPTSTTHILEKDVDFVIVSSWYFVIDYRALTTGETDSNDACNEKSNTNL